MTWKPVALAGVMGLLATWGWLGCRSDDSAAVPHIQPAPLPRAVTAKVEQADDLNGRTVEDPYRWLEDADSEATLKWVEGQNSLSRGWLDAIPERALVRSRVKRLWNYERHGAPRRHGNRYFFTHNNGLQNQAVLYVSEGLDGTPRPLLDPNLLAADGTAALSGYAVSEDGSLLAYALSRSGSDWREIKVRDVATGLDRDDDLQWVKFSSPDWRKDGSGFFYARYDAPADGNPLVNVNYNQKLYFHRLGTPQEEDLLVFHDPEHKTWGFGTDVTDDDRYLVLTIREGTDTRRRIRYLDLQDATAVVTPLLDAFDASYSFVGSEGKRFWFLTDRDAPRGRLIGIDLDRPDPGDWIVVVPESEDQLEQVTRVGGRFICHYLRDAHSRVVLANADGSIAGEVDLPGLGTASGFGGKAGDPETFFQFTSFINPGTLYRLDADTGESTLYRRPAVEFEPEDYTTQMVFYQSRDGSRGPMFISYRQGLRRNGLNPTLLYGYGGFNISMTPRFSPANLAWMEMGGVYAHAILRGGGEYGEDWHQAGMKGSKQNVFDDFIAAAEWLMVNHYTRPDKLAIHGRSNGGLLVGACMTQRPDLFAAALPAVGVMDMLRYHKFTIGWAWTSEYGSPDDPDAFGWLLGYSPLHNLRPGVAYPATLVTTGDHDDRVVPAHSYKFTARLQECQAGPNPVLIRIDTKAGHGSGKPTDKLIDEVTDQWAFLVRVLDMQPRRVPGWEEPEAPLKFEGRPEER